MSNRIYTSHNVFTLSRDGNEDELRIALSQRDKPTYWYRDHLNSTAGHEAAKNGHINCLEMILDCGFDINMKNSYEETIFNLAENRNHMHIIDMLLKRGGITDIHTNNMNEYIDNRIYNPYDVYKFAQCDNKEKLIIALSQGDNSTNWHRDIFGITAAHEAARKGYIECLEILLDRGFDINMKTNNGSTLLYMASKGRKDNVIEMLLNREGIDTLSEVNGLTTIQFFTEHNSLKGIEILFDRGININNKNRDGNTILHLAAKRSNHETIKMLVHRADIDINVKNNNDESALHMVAKYNGVEIESGYMHSVKSSHKTVEILLESGITINNDIDNYTYVELDDDYVDPDRVHYIDFRCMIFNEVNRRKKDLFDSFINRHIEYQPYISSIYTRCYPITNLTQVDKPRYITSNLFDYSIEIPISNVQVASPPIGWIAAEKIRDKYYFDEIFFYLHMGIANFYSNNRPGAVITSSLSSSCEFFASRSNKTSTLMAIFMEALIVMLKPNQNLGVMYSYTPEMLGGPPQAPIDNDDNEDNDNNDD